MQRQTPARRGAEGRQNLVRDRPNALIPDPPAIQRQVNLPVRSHRAHVSVQGLPDRERSRQITVIEQTAMRMVHRRVVAERRFTDHQNLHRLPLGVHRRSEVEITVEPGTRNDAVRPLVQRHVHHQPVPLLQGPGLFADRQEQIFFQPPIQKDPDARIHAHDPQKSEFTDRRIRRLGRRDQPVLGIPIDKHIHQTPDLRAARQIAPRQQNFPMRSAVEIESRSGFADEGELVAFADVCHVTQHRGRKPAPWGGNSHAKFGPSLPPAAKNPHGGRIGGRIPRKGQKKSPPYTPIRRTLLS